MPLRLFRPHPSPPSSHIIVIPAEAGIYTRTAGVPDGKLRVWILTFAGMTGEDLTLLSSAARLSSE